MITNIFLNSYQQPENKLTYNFFAVLEILNSKNLVDFLTDTQSAEHPITEIKTVYGGGETNPDGSFKVNLLNGKAITIFYENKTYRRGIDVNQLKGHLKRCEENDLLLVTSTRKSDATLIQGLNDKRIIFKTWQEIALFLKNNFQDNPITLQFVDYGKKSGEFDELGEIDSDYIKKYCEYQKIKIDFDKKIENIFRHFVVEIKLIFEQFGFNNINLYYENNWGRKGTEIRLKNTNDASYGQFGAISLYYDEKDHGISFKENVPELVFFFDIGIDNNNVNGIKQMLQNDATFREITKALVSDGFESSLDNELSTGLWRLLIYRQPISNFEIINVQELIKFTEKVVSILLKNNAISHRYFSEFC